MELFCIITKRFNNIYNAGTKEEILKLKLVLQ